MNWESIRRNYSILLNVIIHENILIQASENVHLPTGSVALIYFVVCVETNVGDDSLTRELDGHCVWLGTIGLPKGVKRVTE